MGAKSDRNHKTRFVDTCAIVRVEARTELKDPGNPLPALERLDELDGVASGRTSPARRSKPPCCSLFTEKNGSPRIPLRQTFASSQWFA